MWLRLSWRPIHACSWAWEDDHFGLPSHAVFSMCQGGKVLVITVAQGTRVVIPCIHAKDMYHSLSSGCGHGCTSEHSAALTGCHLFTGDRPGFFCLLDPLQLGLGLCLCWKRCGCWCMVRSVTSVITAQIKAGQASQNAALHMHRAVGVLVLGVNVDVEVDQLCSTRRLSHVWWW